MLPLHALADDCYDTLFATLKRLSFLASPQVPRDHPLFQISSRVDGKNLITDANGYFGTMEEIQRDLMRFFKANSNPPADGRRYLNAKQAVYLHNFVRNHPIVGLKNTREVYDPEGCLGFCFGRATVNHAEAVLLGIDPQSIFKFWVAGPMKTDRVYNPHYSVEWDFHVATLFKTAEGEWLVLDEFYESPLTAIEWMELHQSIAERDYRLLFYVSEPTRFEVDTDRVYSVDAFFFDPQFETINRYHFDYFSNLPNQSLLDLFPNARPASQNP